jgi:glycerol-3-phosphate dehydrogenase
LMRHEFAETPDDVLWRRSKLGLHLTADAVAALTRFMENGGGRAAASA